MARVCMTLLALLGAVSAFAQDVPRRRYVPFDSRLYLRTGSTTRPAEGDPALRTPLLIHANPSTIGAGEAAGLYINIAPWATPTPAAGDLVGAVVRVANTHMQSAPGMWAMNTLTLHQGGAPPGGVHIRGLEVEVGHQETSASKIQTDPWGPLVPGQIRANGVEVTLQASTPERGAAAFMADSAFLNLDPDAKWAYGFAARGVRDAVLYDNSGAVATVLIAKDGRRLWSIRAGSDGAFMVWDETRGRASVAVSPSGIVHLWAGGVLRPVSVGPLNGGGSGFRMLLVPN